MKWHEVYMTGGSPCYSVLVKAEGIIPAMVTGRNLLNSLGLSIPLSIEHFSAEECLRQRGLDIALAGRQSSPVVFNNMAGGFNHLTGNGLGMLITSADVPDKQEDGNLVYSLCSGFASRKKLRTYFIQQKMGTEPVFPCSCESLVLDTEIMGILKEAENRVLSAS